MIQRAVPAGFATMLLLVSAPGAGAEPLAERPFVPVPPAAGGPRVDGETWFQEGPGYAVQLTRLDAAARGEYIRLTTGVDADPFLAVADGTDEFTTFLVQVKNRGEADLAFNPLNCWMRQPGGSIHTPLGLADMSMAFHAHGRELPPDHARIAAALLDAPARVAGGGALHGLLAYRGPGPQARGYEVSVELVLGTGDVARMTASYARAKRRKPPKDGDDR